MKSVSRIRELLFGVGEMKYPLHLDNDGVLKCPIQANFEQVTPIESLAAPELRL